jgi:hypothetical protein
MSSFVVIYICVGTFTFLFCLFFFQECIRELGSIATLKKLVSIVDRSPPTLDFIVDVVQKIVTSANPAITKQVLPSKLVQSLMRVLEIDLGASTNTAAKVHAIKALQYLRSPLPCFSPISSVSFVTSY